MSCKPLKKESCPVLYIPREYYEEKKRRRNYYIGWIKKNLKQSM